MNTIKIAIIDDHKILRDGLKALINEMEGTEVVFEASNGKEFLTLLNTFTPDLAIIDINMPIMGGEEAIRQAKIKQPLLKTIVLSMYSDEQYFNAMKQVGADGYIMKESDYDELTQAVTTVMRGGKYFSQQLLLNLIDKKNSKASISLTPREKEILILLSKGFSTHEIAAKLFLSERTIEKHRSELLVKTESANSISLIIYAIRTGLIDI